MSPIRFDENADAQVTASAWAAFAYSHTMMDLGKSSQANLEAQKKRFLSNISGENYDLYFTSGGTEADAMALWGTLGYQQGVHVVTTTIEHAAVYKNLDALQEISGVCVTKVPARRNGAVIATDVFTNITNDTYLVSVVLASNETGVIQPVSEIARYCRSKNILLHVDAIQALGKIPISLEQMQPDLISFSGHKMGSLAGIGALSVRKGINFRPPFYAHACAETEFFPGAAALVAALENIRYETFDTIQNLRNDFEQQVSTEIPNIEIIGQGLIRLPNTSCIRFFGCPGEAMMMALDQEGFAVSTGSACSSGSVQPSQILLGMGLNKKEAREAVRFSFPNTVTQKALEILVDKLKAIVQTIRTVDGFI